MFSHLCFGAYLLAVLRAASAQCLYTPTKCQCKREISGNLCLHYSSETMEGTLCQSYECGAGYVCHCKLSIHLHLSYHKQTTFLCFIRDAKLLKQFHIILTNSFDPFVMKQVVATKFVTSVHVKAIPSLIKLSTPSWRTSAK